MEDSVEAESDALALVLALARVALGPVSGPARGAARFFLAVLTIYRQLTEVKRQSITAGMGLARHSVVAHLADLLHAARFK